MIKGVTVALMFLILCPIVLSQTTQPTPPSQGIDPAILRFIQQEQLKTRSEIKAYMDTSLTTNRDLIQEQVEYNKGVIYSDLDRKIRGAIFKVGIVWFVATLTAMICYRFIIMAVRKKFVRKGLRDEYSG